MLENSADEPIPVRVISEAIGDYISKLGAVWIEGNYLKSPFAPGLLWSL